MPAIVALINQCPFSSGAYLYTVLFGVIAWRIKRRSRTFAIAGLCLYIFAEAYPISVPQTTPLVSLPIYAFLLLVFYINGVRGTFAFHRLSPETDIGYWFWPKIVDLPAAVSTSNQGFWAAVFLTVVKSLFVALILLLGSGTIDIWAYLEVLLFGVVAWGVKRRSKVFATAGLCLFILYEMHQFSQPQLLDTLASRAGAVTAAVLFLIFFINSVRGTFAYHRLSSESAVGPVGQDA